VKIPEHIKAEIWQHALDLTEPNDLRRLVEVDVSLRKK
jgi:hypothetical protein